MTNFFNGVIDPVLAIIKQILDLLLSNLIASEDDDWAHDAVGNVSDKAVEKSSGPYINLHGALGKGKNDKE